MTRTINKTIESETLTLPELKPLIGRAVRIIVTEEGIGLTIPDKAPDIAQIRKLAQDINFDEDAFWALRAGSKV